MLLILLAQDPTTAPQSPTTDAAAKAVWDSLAEATLAEKPATAFDLHFHLRVRPDDIQSNDLTAHYRFLSPGFVRATLESGREHLRGPQGDYLIDGEETLKLVGREAAEDKRQIDESIGVARNFLALTDPTRLKPSSIHPAAAPTHLLPPLLQERARDLRWINITTSGFHLLSSARAVPEGGRRVQQALLGISADAPVLQLAIVVEDTLSSDSSPIAPSQHVLLDLRRTASLDSFQVPRHLRVHQLSRSGDAQIFRSKPSFELWLRGGTLRPKFSADAFLP